jgi:hypothetical protein
MRKPTKTTGNDRRMPPTTKPRVGRTKATKTKLVVRQQPFRLQLLGASNFFAKLSNEYAEANDGYRMKLYVFAQLCYRIGLGYSRRLDEFATFKEDPFWANVRQRPKDDKIMRAVLMFTMKARSAKLASSITKTAKVLESMASQDVKPGEVAKRLKAGGGILKMYAELSPSRSDIGRIADDLELLCPKVGENDAEDGSEVDANEADQEETDRSKADPLPNYGSQGSLRAKEASTDDY